MTKIQCARDFECEACHRRGMLQILGNYARVRHYIGLDSVSKKPRFEYHKQRLDYVKSIMEIDRPASIDLIGHNVDLELKGNTLKFENKSSSSPCSGSIVRSSIVASRPHKRNNGEGQSRTRVQIPAGAPLLWLVFRPSNGIDHVALSNKTQWGHLVLSSPIHCSISFGLSLPLIFIKSSLTFGLVLSNSS